MVAENSLAEINKALGGKIKLALVGQDQLEYLEKNARFMPNETYSVLVENVKRDGQLSSVPFCVKRGDKYRILSGNHRAKAAKDAGIEQVLVLYTEEELSRSREVAIQLSHNSLVGQDDFAILKSLYEEIENIQEKAYAGLDDKTLETIEKISLDALSEINLEYRSLAFVMLPEEHVKLEEVLKKAMDEINSKHIYVGRHCDYDRVIKAIGEVQDSFHIKNVATSLMGILDVFERHLLDLSEGYMQDDPGDSKNEVPVSTVFGSDRIKETYAITIKKALEKAVKSEELNPKDLWELFYKAACNYLTA